MSSKKSDLVDSVQALDAYCEKLNRFFYSNFHFKSITIVTKLSNRNTFIETKKGNVKLFQSMLYEMKSVLASALDNYMTYKDSLFSDKEFASRAKQCIDSASNELDKMNHFFSNYSIIEQ